LPSDSLVRPIESAAARAGRRNPLAKLGVAALAGGGLLLALYLIAETGFSEVLEAFARGGWGLGFIVAIDVAALCAAGSAWRALLAPLWRGRHPLFIGLRLVREAINTLLPVAQVGGDLIGARLLAPHGPRASLAVASVIADKTVETLAQFVFTVVGVLLLLTRSSDSELTAGFGIGLLIAGPVLIIFFGVQNSRAFAALERMLLSLAERMQWAALDKMAGLHANLSGLYRQPIAIASAFAYHMTAWVIGAFEAWVALAVMGHPIDMVDAFILESLGQAARSAAFLIPGGLGAQEGAFLLIGKALGLPPEFALALSLMKRASQLIFGLPALACWPILEARRQR
jgi:putative membrane protein